MNETILKLVLLKTGAEYEVLMDNRMSLRQNLEFLDKLNNCDTFADKYIMYKELSIILNDETPIREYSLPQFARLYLL